MKFPAVFIAVAAALSAVHSLPAQTPAADAKALADKIVVSHGGADKLLRTFKFTEVYLLAGKDKGTERTSTLQPPNLWYVGKTGKERMRTELKKIERLAALPVDLPKPEDAKP